jgi:hypothetical protein
MCLRRQDVYGEGKSLALNISTPLLARSGDIHAHKCPLSGG